MSNDLLLNNSEKNNTNTNQTAANPPLTGGSKKFDLLALVKSLKPGQSYTFNKKVTDQKREEIDALETAYPYVVTGTSLLTMPPDSTPNLWDPFLKKQGLTTLTGSSDLGKSSFLRQLAISVALKKDAFLGHPLNVRHGRVIYFTTEDSQASICELLQKQLKHINPGDLSGLCYVFNAEEPLKVIEQQLKVAPTDVVIVDCISDIFDGQMNDIGSVRRYLNKFNKLSLTYDCLFIFLHHNGKRTDTNAPHKSNIIGSQGFEAKMRLVMELKKEGDTQRNLWFTKGNYLPENIKKHSLQLEFDELQEFTYVGKSQVYTAKNNNKFISSKNNILQSIQEIQDKGKISQDNLLVELRKLYPDHAPSKGTLNKWLREIDSDLME